MTEIVHRILCRRGIEDPAAELDYAMSGLPHFNRIGGCEAAGKRIAEAVLQGEHITIVGDFDCDGCTATALVLRALRIFGASCDYIMPLRSEGHGTTPQHIEQAKNLGASLVITVDNGSESLEASRTAKDLGMDLIVTDHHTITGEKADTPWLVNPREAADDPLLASLAGVGVALYTMFATRAALREAGREIGALTPCYELAAIGTISDLMTLNKVNRILVKAGLDTINSGKISLGLQELLRAMRVKQPITAQDISFRVAPPVNAAGRLSDMSKAVDLFMADATDIAQAGADQLVGLNEQRKVMTAKRVRQATSQIQDASEDGEEKRVLGVFQPDWELGVIGLVASALAGDYKVPALAFTSADPADEQALVRGSMRTVPGISAIGLIAAVAGARPQLIAGYGGHAGAAGLQLPSAACIPLCIAAMEEVLQQDAAAAEAGGEAGHDGALPADALTKETADAINACGPWGRGWELPSFCQSFTLVSARVVGKNSNVLACTLAPAAGEQRPNARIEAVAFNWQGDIPQHGQVYHARYELQLDSWSQAGVKLLLRSFEPLSA